MTIPTLLLSGCVKLLLLDSTMHQKQEQKLRRELLRYSSRSSLRITLSPNTHSAMSSASSSFIFTKRTSSFAISLSISPDREA